MGSLRKQSRLVDQENAQQVSPKKTSSGGGLSPQKQARSKMLKTSLTTGDEYMLKSFGEANTTKQQKVVSPLKKKMRLFESQESPQKSVADLQK